MLSRSACGAADGGGDGESDQTDDENAFAWVNDWAVLHNQAEEGGFKRSGQGRMRGLAVMDDFIEYKHIALAPGRRDNRS